MTAVISRAKIAERRAAGERLGTASRRYLNCLKRGDPDRCSYCGCKLTDTNRTIDHIISVLRGGSDLIENLCLACQSCNSRKGHMTAVEFRKLLGVRAIKPVTPSLGVRRQPRSLPIGLLLSEESQRALRSLNENA